MAVVAGPVQCMVGCTSCKVWCIFEAISFLYKKVVRDLIKKKDTCNFTPGTW
ncbi:MAG: hypothetical protein NC937_05000 [Candidatus Omnitrophica bacterium]|nr:hypothetical protein [Candidatus Omnitrophota bacterium]